MTVYLESAALEAEDKVSPIFEKRGQKDVSLCQHPNWGWPCWWQPAVGQRIHTGGGTVFYWLELGRLLLRLPQ